MVHCDERGSRDQGNRADTDRSGGVQTEHHGAKYSHLRQIGTFIVGVVSNPSSKGPPTASARPPRTASSSSHPAVTRTRAR